MIDARRRRTCLWLTEDVREWSVAARKRARVAFALLLLGLFASPLVPDPVVVGWLALMGLFVFWAGRAFRCPACQRYAFGRWFGLDYTRRQCARCGSSIEPRGQVEAATLTGVK
jgi:hypothetical protein